MHWQNWHESRCLFCPAFGLSEPGTHDAASVLSAVWCFRYCLWQRLFWIMYINVCPKKKMPDFSDIHESCHRSANRRRRDWKHAESRKAAWMFTLKNRRFLPSPRLERVAGDVFQCGTWKKQRKMWPPRDSYIGSTWMLWILKLISFNLGMATSSGTLKALALAGCCLSENRSALFQASLGPGTGTQRLFAPHREPLWLVLRQLAVAQQQTPSWCSSGFLWRPC